MRDYSTISQRMAHSLRARLIKSPAARMWAKAWYCHSGSTALFSAVRAVNVDTTFEAPDFGNALWTAASGWGPPVSIARHMRVIWGLETDFSQQRVALLAHWDPDGLVDAYVLHYARHLNACGFAVVLAGGGPVEVTEECRNVFAAAVYRTCPGYDFTSWKGALEALPSLLQAAELFLINDSIFAPVGDLRPILQSMREVPCDFWGLVQTKGGPQLSFLHSYALLFRPAALGHPALAEFFARIPPDAQRDFALKHEVRLAQWLHFHGLSAGAWLPAEAMPWPWFDLPHLAWRQILRLGLPVMKRDMFFGRGKTRFPRGWERIARQHGYPVELIRNYLRRVQVPRESGTP